MDFDWEERSDDTPFSVHMIAGCFAGVIEHYSLLPFDQIKTHMQVEGKRTHNIFEITKKIYKHNGISGFWRGGSTIFLGCAPAHAAYFSIYEFSKTMLKVKDEKLYPILFGAAGVFGSIVHDVIMNPFDVVKQRAQINENMRPLDIAKKTFREEGIISFYRSLPITIIMNVPWSFVLVSANENFKVLFGINNNPSFLKYFTCAAFSAAIASFFTIPLDNIKTRLQTQTWKDTLYESSMKNIKSEKINAGLAKSGKAPFSTISENLVKYKNIFQTIQIIQREEGMIGFLKGVTPRIMSQAPSSAISWSAYEVLKMLLTSKSSRY